MSKNKHKELQTTNPNEPNYVEWRYLQGMPVGNLNTLLEKINAVVPAAEVSKAYVDKQDQSVLTTANNNLDSAKSEVTKTISDLAQSTEQAIEDLSGDIVDEKQARVQAVTEESTARQENDSTLYDMITNESTTREGVDDKLINNIETLQSTKQDTLVSGTTIKTINGQTLLGSGNIEIGGGTTTLTGLYLWPKGVTLGTSKTFNMGTSKRIICKLFMSEPIYGTVYVQNPAYYVFDFSGEKGETVFINSYFLNDWKYVYSALSGTPTQTYDHRKDDSLGVWGWFGLEKQNKDESRQLRYIYDSTNNTITFGVVDHNDLSYVLEVQAI